MIEKGASAPKDLPKVLFLLLLQYSEAIKDQTPDNKLIHPEGTNTQTHTHTDIATTRLNRPRGR